MDILLIKTFAGSEEIALYNTAFKLASLVSLVLIATNSVSAPLFSSLYVQRKKDELQSLVFKETKMIFLSALVVSSLLAIFSDSLLSFFGSEFSAAKTQVFILIVGQIINAGTGSVGYLLNMTGHQNDTARVLGVSAIFNLVISLFLIPSFGGTGAAIGTSLTMILWNVWMAFIVFRKLDIYPTIFGEFLHQKLSV